NRLHRYRRTWLTARQKPLERAAFVLDSFLRSLAVGPCDRRECVVLVRVEGDALPRAAPALAADAAEHLPTHTLISPCAEAPRFHPINGTNANLQHSTVRDIIER